MAEQTREQRLEAALTRLLRATEAEPARAAPTREQLDQTLAAIVEAREALADQPSPDQLPDPGLTVQNDCQGRGGRG